MLQSNAVTQSPFTRERSTESETGISLVQEYQDGRAASSAGEHPLHTGRVTGSIPVPPTIGPNHWSLAPHSFDLTYIYVMECAGAYKVGITGNLARRLSGIQLANPLPVTILTYRSCRPSVIREVERQILEELSPYRIHGEWFRCPLDLVTAARGKAIARNRGSLPLHAVAQRADAWLKRHGADPSIRALGSRPVRADIGALPSRLRLAGGAA